MNPMAQIALGHVALVAFLVAGYVSAFYKAKSVARSGQLWWTPSPFSRVLSRVVFVAAPVLAAVGVYVGWHGPLIPQFVGGGINITCFLGASVQVLAKNRSTSGLAASATDGQRR
jgi:hypothetical protein